MNYALTVALGQVTRAVIGQRLDPCIGFLHSPKPSRPSLSYDVLELLRADVAQTVFGFTGKRVFRCAEFEVDPHSVVRLSASVAREIAALVLRRITMTDCVKACRKVAAWF